MWRMPTGYIEFEGNNSIKFIMGKYIYRITSILVLLSQVNFHVRRTRFTYRVISHELQVGSSGDYRWCSG
jgi:hypothetical protein